MANESTRKKEAAGEMEGDALRWGMGDDSTRDVAYLYSGGAPPPAHVEPLIPQYTRTRNAAGQRGRKEAGASGGCWAAGVGPRALIGPMRARNKEPRSALNVPDPDAGRNMS